MLISGNFTIISKKPSSLFKDRRWFLGFFQRRSFHLYVYGNKRNLLKFKSFILGFCACGCGTEIRIRSIHKNDCYLKRYVKGHISRIDNYFSKNIFEGEKHWNWKNGTGTWNGYKNIKVANKKYKREHREIYNKYYNCELLPYVVLHHIDGNKFNNEISNLQPMYRKQHCIIHKDDRQ